MNRLSKMVTNKEDHTMFLNITEEKALSLSFFMETFCPFKGKEAKYHVYDLITIPAGYYGKNGITNKTAFTTTLGRWIFNKGFIEQELFDLFHYINRPINKKLFESMNTTMSYALLEDRISLEVMNNFVMKTQKFQGYCTVISSSITPAALNIPAQIRGLKTELLNKYKDGIEAKDPKVSEKIEKELLAKCKELLKDDQFMDLINSDARISWGNNFKNIFVFRGAAKDADPTKGGYEIIKSNFMDGISADDYAAYANSLIGGPYSRAKKTEVGGAWEKMFVRAFQHIRVLDKGTDCGTHRTLEILLTPDNIGNWMYSYVVDNGKLVELTTETSPKYLNKKVKLRFSALCEDKKGICSICAGSLFHRIDLTEVGIASYAICSFIKNKSMKAFHDGTVKTTDVEATYGLDKIFGLE